MLRLNELSSYFEKHKKFFDSPEVEVIMPQLDILEEDLDWEKILRRLERAIRTAYQSFDRIWPDSHYKLLRHILALHHESTLEHEKITFRLITNRWVTHELVRHRIASYTQESTRYVKYWQKHWYKVIYPVHLAMKTEEEVKKWYEYHLQIAKMYWDFLNNFWRKPQEARWILPNDLKTEIVVTMNLREIRHFISLRASKFAHSDIRILAWELLYRLSEKIPIIFDDLLEKVEKWEL